VGAARATTAAVLEALEPWSTGTSLVNFEHPEPNQPSSAWAPDVLERLRRVKTAVDPRNVFGGIVSAPEPVGAR
jgi:FAD/FMN-containing dehydrogenase